VNTHRKFLPLITLKLLLSGLRFEIERTIISWMALFLTFEVPPILPGSYPTNESLLPIQQMSPRSSTLDLLSEYSLSGRKASRPFPATSVKGEMWCIFLNFISLQTLWNFPVPQSAKSDAPRSWGYSRFPFWENIQLMRALLFASWIWARNNGGRTLDVTKSIIPLRTIHSISNPNPDKRRFRVIIFCEFDRSWGEFTQSGCWAETP
jgi:hypothetical protein